MDQKGVMKMESRTSLTTKIIETIKEKEDELILNFITDNTSLCEEYKIPKDKIREVFDFYDKNKNNDGWIDVDDRLPSIDGEYLVCFAYGDYVCTADFKTEGCNPTWSNGAEIIAWQPLPKSYKRNKQSDNNKLSDRPKANWEKTNCSTEFFGKLSRCSKCGYETFPQDDTNYCGGCGARMEAKND